MSRYSLASISRTIRRFAFPSIALLLLSQASDDRCRGLWQSHCSDNA
jgi:hypothetical protein